MFRSNLICAQEKEIFVQFVSAGRDSAIKGIVSVCFSQGLTSLDTKPDGESLNMSDFPC